MARDSNMIWKSKRNIWIIFGIFLFFVFLAVNASALTYIDSCQTLSSNDDYILNSSITTDVSSSCLNMSSGGNVTIDGNGFGITITGTGRAISLTGIVNATITNLIINGTYVATYGIYLSNVNVSGIDNVNVTAVKSGSGGGAVYGINLNNITFKNSYLYGNNGTGFYFQRANHLDIINNIFLHDVNYALSMNGFFHNVSFLNFSGNVINKPAVLGSQLVQCSGWINDSVFDDNIFNGKCSVGLGNSLSLGGSVPNRVEIMNNDFIVNCTGISFGSANIPLDGNFSIHGNRFNSTALGCIGLSVMGINLNLLFYNNTCNTEGSGISISIYGNISTIRLHDNIYNYTSSNLSKLYYGIYLLIRGTGTSQYIVNDFLMENENMVSPFPIVGIQIYNISLNITNSNISGLCMGILASSRFSKNSEINMYNSKINPVTSSCFSPLFGSGEIVMTSNQTINLFNTTGVNIANITNGSILNVYWNLTVINPLLANVSIYDSQNNLLSSFTGDNSLWVRQFFQNASGMTNTTPYSIELSKSGYYAKTDSISMNTNKDYTISIRLIIPIIDPSSITGQLVLTLGFGIMGLFAVLTLLGFGYVTATGKPDPETIAKIMIGVVIIILMIVAVWQGIIVPP
jgi:hypothetical protein